MAPEQTDGFSSLSAEDRVFKSRKIDPLLDTGRYASLYEDENVRAMMQALEILSALMAGVFHGPTLFAWNALKGAKARVDGELAKYMTEGEAPPSSSPSEEPVRAA